MNAIAQTKQWAHSHADVMTDLVRIYLGLGLFIKGIYFMSHREFLQQLLQGTDNSVFLHAAVAHYVIPAHIVGGILLALGLLTRFAALAQIPILLGAILYVYLPKAMFLEPRQNLEFTALLLFLMVLFVIFGAGRLSLDKHLFNPTERHPLPASATA
jgi:uncharacterized membrane protein YphA (DoxX/SURF4 family)